MNKTFYNMMISPKGPISTPINSSTVSHGAKLARCGWAAGDNSDSYAPDTVAASLPGMGVLSGWEDALAQMQPCSIIELSD